MSREKMVGENLREETGKPFLSCLAEWYLSSKLYRSSVRYNGSGIICR